jgi:hypothetical protein
MKAQDKAMGITNVPLTRETVPGRQIEGSDPVKMVKCK